MNARVFSLAMSEVSDQYISEAIAYQHKRKRAGLAKWCAAAACLCAAVTGTFLYYAHTSENPFSEPIDAATRPMIVVNGTLYGISPDPPYDDLQTDCEYIGQIQSAVDTESYPTEELQANDEIIGAEVYQYHDDIVVRINGQYWVYEKIETRENSEFIETGCYVSTEQSPEAILAYAQEVFPEFLRKYMISNSIEPSGKQFTLGYPINLQEWNSSNRIYHFPVMENGEIFAILTIYDNNGEYYVQIEQSLMAETLRELQAESSQNHPIYFVSTDDGLFAVVGGYAAPLDPECASTASNMAEISEADVFISDSSTLMGAVDSIVINISSVLATANNEYYNVY